MRVGLMGGSFDPAHEGHVHAAKVAMAALDLHRVVWLVSPQNPLKTRRPAPLAERVRLAQAIAPRRVVASGLEADLASPYTVETLRWARRRWPGVRLYWIMGTDNLLGFHRWRCWREIPRLATVVVVPRQGSTVRGRAAPGGRYLAGRAIFLDAPLNGASSTAIRSRARR